MKNITLPDAYREYEADYRKYVYNNYLDVPASTKAYLDIIFLESGGDNLAATFSPDLVDFSIYIIDVAQGEKIPRKAGQGMIKSDLFVINKIDLIRLNVNFSFVL